MKKLSLVLFSTLFIQSCATNVGRKPIEQPVDEPVVETPDPINKRALELGCDLVIQPGDSIYSAFGRIDDGQLLCLEDGIYNQLVMVPSDKHIRALNDGMAEIDGRGIDAGWRGVFMMRGDNASARGLKIHHGSYNASACKIGGTNNKVTAISCSHGGQYKHAIPISITGSGHVIGNSWFYGEGRYVLMCYQGEKITIRGNVMRWDKTKPGEANEPNATMSNYSCSDTIWENNISLDYGKPQTRMRHCGDICMSTTPMSPNKNVKYLGNIIVNHHPETGNNRGMMADQKSRSPSSDILVKDFFVSGSRVGVGVNPRYQNFKIENCTMTGVKKNISKKGSRQHCQGNADIDFKYIDGNKTDQPLWPWPNQELIKRDMCAEGERQSDWCKTDLSLTDYIATYRHKAKASAKAKQIN